MKNEMLNSLKISEVRGELANLQRTSEKLEKTICLLEERFVSVLGAPIVKCENEGLHEKPIVVLAGEIRDINRQLVNSMQHIEDIALRCEL